MLKVAFSGLNLIKKTLVSPIVDEAGWFLRRRMWAGAISGCEKLTAVGSGGYGSLCGTPLKPPRPFTHFFHFASLKQYDRYSHLFKGKCNETNSHL